MRVYYVTNRFDDYEYIYIDRIRLFQTEESAQSLADELDNQRLISWKTNESRNKQKWEINELAIDALEKAGIDWKISFPNHKRNWSPSPFEREYVVESLEVE